MNKNAVTPELIEKQICAIQYHQFPGTTVTIACVTLKNGFSVIGQAACVDPDNFNLIMGQEIALEDAKSKIWSFLGFRLRDVMVAEVES